MIFENAMLCPTCGHEMDIIDEPGYGPDWLHCKRCGTAVARDKEDGETTAYVPKLLNVVKDIIAAWDHGEIPMHSAIDKAREIVARVI